MKGLVDPFGLVCIGAAIFAGETYAEESMFKILAVALALVCLLWTYTAHRLSQEWLDMLRDSVRKRFLDGQSVSIAGKPMTALLLTKLESGQETEAIYALRMLEDNPLVDFNQGNNPGRIALTSRGRWRQSAAAATRLQAAPQYHKGRVQNRFVYASFRRRRSRWRDCRLASQQRFTNSQSWR